MVRCRLAAESTVQKALCDTPRRPKLSVGSSGSDAIFTSISSPTSSAFALVALVPLVTSPKAAFNAAMGEALDTRAAKAAPGASRRSLKVFPAPRCRLRAAKASYLGLSENVVYPIFPNGFADHYPY